MPSTYAILLFLLDLGFFFKLILLVLLYVDTLIHVSLNISFVNLYILNAEA